MSEQVSTQPFKAHVCVDCGVKLSKFGWARCKKCNIYLCWYCGYMLQKLS